MAVEVETGRFTVGVFQDIAWAEKGVDALRKQGLAVESLSILGKASPEMAAFIERTLGAPQSLDVHDLGPLMARGPLVAALQGSDQGLSKAGHRRHDAARRISGARRPHFSCADRPGRRAGGHSQRAEGRGRAGSTALVRWRKRRNWSLDRTGLARVAWHRVRRAGGTDGLWRPILQLAPCRMRAQNRSRASLPTARSPRHE